MNTSSGASSSGSWWWWAVLGFLSLALTGRGEEPPTTQNQEATMVIVANR